MLADRPVPKPAGRIEQDILLPAAARYELLDFIAQELPRWRDHPDRQVIASETRLTDQLCDHLNGAASYSTAWSHVQFRTEVPDEEKPGRKIDLTIKPCGTVMMIEGRRHSQFDVLLPIECKRLPTPKDTGRDEREYVTNEPGTTGGIQRFKMGLHGSAHDLGAMIAYVQDQTCSYWMKRVNGWIQDLSIVPDSRWDGADVLRVLSDDSREGLCLLRSHHHRGNSLARLELRHLWIKMN